MRITNITNIAKGTELKWIGIGEYRIMPGESMEIPDEVCYCIVKGKKVILPSIRAMIRTNQISIVENTAPAAPVEEEKPAVTEKTDEEKKAEAAKKRAETRAANQAAKKAAAAKA